MSYKLFPENMVRENLTGKFFRSDVLNSDVERYQDWLAKGNTPDPADVVDPMIAIRAERDRLLAITDIEINKMEDGGVTATVLRLRRVALRDLPINFPNADMATFDWTVI